MAERQEGLSQGRSNISALSLRHKVVSWRDMPSVSSTISNQDTGEDIQSHWICHQSYALNFPKDKRAYTLRFDRIVAVTMPMLQKGSILTGDRTIFPQVHSKPNKSC